VLNWNGREDTLECLNSIQRVRYRNLHVIAVDNGSTDGSAEAIRAAFPSIDLIVNAANLGFAEGNNIGIRRALVQGAEFVLLLNNDTTVDPDLISELVAGAALNPRAGVLGPKIYYYSVPTRIWSAGGKWNETTMRFEQIGDGEEDSGQHETTCQTEFVVGCAMFIRSNVFRQVGLLEPKFFLNYEEIDFCARVRKAGLENLYVPKARLWHKVAASFGGETSPLKSYFNVRNRLLWAERNLALRRQARIHSSIYASLSRRLARPVIDALRRPEGRLRSAVWAMRSSWTSPINRAWLYGVRDYWRRRFGVCPEEVWDLQRQWQRTSSASRA
jgi:hypothetical protein